MPTILRIDGVRVAIYPNDHRPPHVHVIGAGKEAVFYIDDPNGRPVLRGNSGFTTAELNRISAALATKLFTLCAAWERIYGDYR